MIIMPRPCSPQPGRFLAVATVVLFAGRVLAGEPRGIDFSRDVLPILSDNCFKCHGPDAKARKAKLRLDTQDGALRKDSPVIVPGKSEDSELVRRITSDEPGEVMPPVKSNKKLTVRQVETLKRWIDDGANWGRHWAFEAPRRPSVPRIRNTKYETRNPIDNFILARLEKEGLSPSPEADR